MTLNTQLQTDHKIHRIHQHQYLHHHYHVHHLLHHHHQHIHDQIATHQNHLHSLKDHAHNHNHNHKQVLPARKIPNQIVAPTERDQHISTNASRRHLSRSASQRTQIQFFLVAAVAYVLSPIDLIPEAIFGIFGILDDLLFLFMCLLCVAVILIYPIFRDMQRTIFDKLGLTEGQAITNKSL